MGGCVSTVARRTPNENSSNASINNTKPIATPNCLWLNGLKTRGFVVWCVLVVGLLSPSPGSSGSRLRNAHRKGFFTISFTCVFHLRNTHEKGFWNFFYMCSRLGSVHEERSFGDFPLRAPKLILVITQASGNHVERFEPAVHVCNLHSLGRIAGQLLVAQKIVS